MMMNPKIFLLIGLTLVFLANLDLVKADDRGNIVRCLECPDKNTKCKAADAKLGDRCRTSLVEDSFCYSYFDDETSTNGAKRGCDTRSRGTIALGKCTSELNCYCVHDGCNDKDSYNEANGGSKPEEPGVEKSTVDPTEDKKSPAPNPVPSPDSSKGPTIGFNFITTLAMITINIILY